MAAKEETCRVDGCESAPKPGRQGRCSTHYWRDYRASRRDELNANYKAWAKKRGPRRKLMTPDQKLADRLWNAARRARSLGAEVLDVSVRDVRRLEHRLRNRCAYCDKKAEATLHLEHIIPLFQGGRHSIGNLTLACEDCNKAKGAQMLTEWRKPRWGETF